MDLRELDSWFSLLRAVSAAALLISVAQFLGSNCLVWARLDLSQKVWYRFHLASVLGLNLLGLAALAASWLPFTFRNTVALALCVVAILWALRRVGSDTKLCIESWRSCVGPHALWVVPILISLGPALAYPSGWDELCYHHELPRRWYDAGGISVQLDLPYSALPSLLEVIFTFTYPIESLITPRLIIWIIWLHGLLIFREACSQVCRGSNATILTLAMAVSPSALFISANCYVESLIWANMASLLLMALAHSNSTCQVKRFAIVLGVFIGGSIAVKMTSIGLMCLPILLTLLQSERIQLKWPQAIMAVLTALCFASPFYLRTWLWTGNPVAPFFAYWFTSDTAWIECSRYHHDLAVSNFGMRGVPGFLMGPGALAFASELYDGSLGWQWLLTLVLLAVANVRASRLEKPRRKMIWLCLATAALFYGLWFITAQQVRFTIPLVMIVIVAAGIGIETYRDPIQRWWRVALVGLSLISIPWNNFGYYLDSWFCVLKISTPVDYIRDGVTDSYAELAIYLHESITPDAKIVSLCEHRLAYLPRGVEIATPYFQVKYFCSPEEQTSKNLMAELRSHDIDYVVITTNPLGPDISTSRIEDQQKWFQSVDQCIATGQLKVIWKSDQHAVAEVVSQPDASTRDGIK